MKKLAEFRAFGVKPVPWSTPQVFMKIAKSGKRFKSSTRSKALTFWQNYVKEFARDAVADNPLCLGPIGARLDFTVKTTDRRLHGQVCCPEVAWSDDKEEWVKKGASLADTDNLSKAVLDACQGVIFANDVQVVILVATRRHGPDDSVRVKVWEITQEDPVFQE